MLDAYEEKDLNIPQRFSSKVYKMEVKAEDSVFLGVQHLGRGRSNFDVHPLAIREPVQVNQDCCDMTLTRFWKNHTNKGVLNMLKESQIQCFFYTKHQQ